MSLRDTIVIRNKSKDDSKRGESCLVQIHGGELGKRYTIRAETSAGRDDTNIIFLDHDTVSRQHARFSYRDRNCYVVDLGSTNGTYVNDIRADNETPLSNGDLVKLGGVVFKFFSGDNVEAMYHDELYRMAILDGLTDVHNKRYFLDFLEREMARCLRYGGELSLALIDIDHFKQVNDTFGHPAGDFVLEQIARLIEQRMRREALLARYGGEEYALVLPEINIANARLFCERLRVQIEKHVFLFDGKKIKTTVSIGIAFLDGPMRSAYFIKAADKQLYLAKKRGRNRVEPGYSSEAVT
jgi:diguanylate cyclase (GGDEF)-like protein